tara:strand:+ start:89 stop:580 length:492 start_codon:yes stop_codon:yes gene_type:complete
MKFDIPNIILTQLPNIVFSILILVLFWILAVISKSIIIKLFNKRNTSTSISSVLAGIVKNIFLIIGFISALGTLGVNVSAIVAGLGLTGFAFGFAFKDMLSNFISGVIIFIYEPFKLNDKVEIEKQTGRVIDINLRYVTIEGEDQNILVPNSICVSKVVIVKK